MGYKVSLIKLDFPLPLTPVTQINFPKGNSTVTFFKLLPVAPLITNFFPFPFLRSFGIFHARVNGKEEYCAFDHREQHFVPRKCEINLCNRGVLIDWVKICIRAHVNSLLQSMLYTPVGQNLWRLAMNHHRSFLLDRGFCVPAVRIFCPQLLRKFHPQNMGLS